MKRAPLRLLVLLIAFSQGHRVMASDEPKVIVLINTYGNEAPGRPVFDAAFTRTLRESPVPPDVYLETLDANRVKGAEQIENARAFFRERYARKKVAVVVAVYGAALDFVMGLPDGEPLFPGVPVVATLTRNPDAAPKGVAFTYSAEAISATLASALTLLPRTRHIAIIDSVQVAPERDTLAREVQRQVESVAANIPAIYLQNLAIDELLDRVRALPPDTVILAIRHSLGRNGQPMSVPAAIREVAAVAAAPIFITADQMIGTGATGGIVVDINRMGSELAKLALRVADTGSTDIPPIRDQLTPLWDWPQLQRFGIDVSSLPAGSVVLNRQYTFWDLYRWYAITAIVVVGVQTGLIAGLMASRVRRKRAEAALRQSYDRNRDLAGQLLNAQEAERGRIARDLHDDVSQQLAGLSIMMSGLKQKIGKKDPPAEIDEAVTTIQDHTTTLARSVRNLSHELHPDVLKHAGLVATLRQHCADAAKHYATTVAFTAPEDLGPLSQQAALCLFRVAQEALTNAMRHAQATTITVTLSASSTEVVLHVSDDGVGFAATEKTGRGLGLRSIDERARLLGGRMALTAKPGAGTSLTVRVPLLA